MRKTGVLSEQKKTNTIHSIIAPGLNDNVNIYEEREREKTTERTILYV